MTKPAIAIASTLTLMPVLAFGEDPKQASQEHVAAAKQLHAKHRYREAIGELESAYALDPQPQLLFALGQLHVQLGRCERAIAFYTRFLDSKPRREQAAVAREARETCKSTPPPDDTVVVTAEPEPLAMPRAMPETPPPPTAWWRRSPLANGFVISGLAATVGSLIVYAAASSERDRTTATVLGVGGVVALAGGGFGIAFGRSY